MEQLLELPIRVPVRLFEHMLPHLWQDISTEIDNTCSAALHVYYDTMAICCRGLPLCYKLQLIYQWPFYITLNSQMVKRATKNSVMSNIVCTQNGDQLVATGKELAWLMS